MNTFPPEKVCQQGTAVFGVRYSVLGPNTAYLTPDTFLYRAASENHVAVVEDSGLAGGHSALRSVETALDGSVSRSSRDAGGRGCAIIADACRNRKPVPETRQV